MTDNHNRVCHHVQKNFKIQTLIKQSLTKKNFFHKMASNRDFKDII